MTVDELITALKLCSGASIVVIDTTTPEDMNKPVDPPVEDDTAPIVSVYGPFHDAETIISPSFIPPYVPPEQAPLDPGQAGQLTTMPEPAMAMAATAPAPTTVDEPSHEPFKTTKVTKK